MQIDSPRPTIQLFVASFNFQASLHAICKHITATYQTAKSNKKWILATFKSATLPIVWKRDFNKSGKGITLWGERISLHHPYIPTNTWKDSKLKQIKDKLYLLLSYEKEVPEIKTQGCIVGVDSGHQANACCLELVQR